MAIFAFLEAASIFQNQMRAPRESEFMFDPSQEFFQLIETLHDHLAFRANSFWAKS